MEVSWRHLKGYWDRSYGPMYLCYNKEFLYGYHHSPHIWGKWTLQRLYGTKVVSSSNQAVNDDIISTFLLE